MHEIRKNDGLVLAENAAWHGLGTVVASAPNPFAALRLANMEWQVLESDALAGTFNSDSNDPRRVITGTHKMLVRSDDYSMLGVVGTDYSPVQNETLAELAYAFRKAGEDVGVEVESAGSIRGGRRVWMLLRGPSVDMTGRDDMAHPYLMLANSHDGTMALRVLPTSVRVVCSNTFHAAINSERKAWAFRHTHNISNRIEDLKVDIDRWYKTIDTGRQEAVRMAATAVNRETVRNLWTDVLTRLDGEIPSNPKTGWEERKKERAVEFLAHCAQTFDSEGGRYGYNAWTAVNAATNAIQHYRAGKALRSARHDRQAMAYAAWDGATADATAEAFAAAYDTLLK
jgi:phage/plasmid-like protein (TIGR03299 family)